MDVWRTTKLAPGTILMPGVISHATNIVEHPELVAKRLVDWAGIVGRGECRGRYTPKSAGQSSRRWPKARPSGRKPWVVALEFPRSAAARHSERLQSTSAIVSLRSLP